MGLTICINRNNYADNTQISNRNRLLSASHQSLENKKEMSKIMIWVGQFDSEADFEKYMDQSAFRQWWKDYDEDNKELRCQFCKELGVMSYDEDFLIMKFTSDGLAGLLNLIPADTQR